MVNAFLKSIFFDNNNNQNNNNNKKKGFGQELG